MEGVITAYIVGVALGFGISLKMLVRESGETELINIVIGGTLALLVFPWFSWIYVGAIWLDQAQERNRLIAVLAELIDENARHKTS